MNDRDLIVLTSGGLLLNSGLKRAETAAARAVRANVLRSIDHSAHRWRHRASNAVSVLSVVIGGFVVLYQVRSQRRSGVHQSPDGGRAPVDAQPGSAETVSAASSAAVRLSR